MRRENRHPDKLQYYAIAVSIWLKVAGFAA
jgi:hypothetical protein